MLEDLLADFSALSVREEHMMALRRPVDAGIPFSSDRSCHLPVRARRATAILADPCTGARKRHGPARTPHGASITANPTGHASLSRWSGHRGHSVAPDESARFGRLRRFGPSPQVTLRSATLHFARPAALPPKNRTRKVQGTTTGADVISQSPDGGLSIGTSASVRCGKLIFIGAGCLCSHGDRCSGRLRVPRR